MQAQLRKRERTLIPGVNAKTHELNVIIQIMDPDSEDMLIPGVNGTIVILRSIWSAGLFRKTMNIF